MNDLDSKLVRETAHTMVSWIAGWGKFITADGDSKFVYDFGDTSRLHAARLLVEFGVFLENSPLDYSLINNTPNRREFYELEDIIYIFYDLGAFYSYGVRFREQGFKVENALVELFDNLVELKFCEENESFYFWTDKTFNLIKGGEIDKLGSCIPSLDNYTKTHLNFVLENRKILEGKSSLIKFEIPDRYWKDENLIKSFIDLQIDNKWRENSIVWPANIESHWPKRSVKAPL